MNDNHSRHESSYRPRYLARRLRQVAKSHPVVVLTGPRQAGKSTLLRNEPPFDSWKQQNLDDLDILEQAEREPDALWAGAKNVVIDDVQRAPNALLAIKRTVDNDPKRRFVISGSASLDLLSTVSETLAGRAISFPLAPMTLGEWNRLEPSHIGRDLLAGKLPTEAPASQTEDPIKLILRGFMPTLTRLRRNQDILDWWAGYVSTYLERDLRAISQVSSLADFRRVMELAALRTGQLLNQTQVSRDSAISQPTVHRYLNLLEASYISYRLPAYGRSRGKRLVKSPKLYWADPALAAFLAGHYSKAELAVSREIGGLFENLVFLHLQVLASLLIPQGRLYYWRTVVGTEVDFILEWGRSLVAFECKLSANPKHDDARSLNAFLADYPNCTAGVLVHTGDAIKLMGQHIVALPWTTLAGSAPSQRA